MRPLTLVNFAFFFLATEKLQTIAETALAFMSHDIPRLHMMCNRLGLEYTLCATEEVAPEMRSQLRAVQEAYASLKSKFAHQSLEFASVAECLLHQLAERRQSRSPSDSSPGLEEEEEQTGELKEDVSANIWIS
ncbi:unnamed protein product [Dibothriocephalus latus]|uniref:Uncharacterized protein n=1 Tax=Dibothriocephalus latus TaxID=60516 RepID=A0A3P6T7T9_DIBLA|nr:unnamed protein product [Dibothriocephalus latus]